MNDVHLLQNNCLRCPGQRTPPADISESRPRYHIPEVRSDHMGDGLYRPEYFLCAR